ncbi:hypothetical protein ACFP7A_01300 [Sporolactobacillus kofuensis]|uniref:Uncharacterized protein n=1 Tax=Sporolactobacillus kofuensis TaxID=269672 RepID=A0ABW1W9L7_9BACL|nr:hypothetical protein [Sporolactobacillus kofuensis]MCO7177033.1 hypothetical protein [Sporolactobacillus kofuensis]
MISVFGIDKNDIPRGLEIEIGTVESVKKDLEEDGFTILYIKEKNN